MAITINDFIKECEMFPYSRENYDLVKEAAEINVASMYLENQRFMAENPELASFGESYMMEAADEEAVKNVKENIESKVTKWKNKVKAIWEKIVKALKTFWNAITAKWGKLKDKSADVKKKLSVVTLTEEQSTAIRKLVLDSVASSGIPLAENQKSGYKALPKNVIAGVKDESVKNKLAAVLYNNSIDLTISKESFGHALSGSQLKEFFAKISSRETLAANKDALAKLGKKLEAFQTANLTKGITISKDMEQIKSLITSLEDAEKKFAAEVNKDAEIGFPNGVGDVTELFANAQKAAADSIKLYTTVVRYQELVLNGLANILSKAEAAE